MCGFIWEGEGRGREEILRRVNCSFLLGSRILLLRCHCRLLRIEKPFSLSCWYLVLKLLLPLVAVVDINLYAHNHHRGTRTKKRISTKHISYPNLYLPKEQRPLPDGMTDEESNKIRRWGLIITALLSMQYTLLQPWWSRSWDCVPETRITRTSILKSRAHLTKQAYFQSKNVLGVRALETKSK